MVIQTALNEGKFDVDESAEFDCENFNVVCMCKCNAAYQIY